MFVGLQSKSNDLTNFSPSIPLAISSHAFFVVKLLPPVRIFMWQRYIFVSVFNGRNVQ